MRDVIHFSRFPSQNHTSRQTAEAAIRGANISKSDPKNVITKKQVLDRLRSLDKNKKDEYLSFVLKRVKNKYNYLESLKDIALSQTYEGMPEEDNIFHYVGKYFFDLYGFKHKVDEEEEHGMQTGKISYNDFSMIAERHLNEAMLSIKEDILNEYSLSDKITLNEEFSILTENLQSSFSKTFGVKDTIYKLYYFNDNTDTVCQRNPSKRNPRKSYYNEKRAMEKLAEYDFVLVGREAYKYKHKPNIYCISYNVGYPIKEYNKDLSVSDLEEVVQRLHNIGWHHGDLNLGNFLWFNDKLCLIDFEYSGFGDFEKRKEDIMALNEIRERVFQTVDSGSVLEYLKNKTRNDNLNPVKSRFKEDDQNSTKRALNFDFDFDV
jgi:hypothetical protein